MSRIRHLPSRQHSLTGVRDVRLCAQLKTQDPKHTWRLTPLVRLQYKTTALVMHFTFISIPQTLDDRPSRGIDREQEYHVATLRRITNDNSAGLLVGSAMQP